MDRRLFAPRQNTADPGTVHRHGPVCLLRPDPGARDPHHWALLADTHIAADPKKMARGINMADNFTQICREVIARKASISNVLINGDCAYSRGFAEDYKTFNTLIKNVARSEAPAALHAGKSR